MMINLFLYGADHAKDLGESVSRIEKAFAAKQAMLQEVNGAPIVAIMGSTGSGKSTLVNLMGGVPLSVNDDGEVELFPSSRGIPIGSGFHSITKFPECVDVPQIGKICDLPGFEDTEGALDDVINAAFMHRILTQAGNVKIAFVTSQSDMESARGPAFKRLLRSMHMISDDQITSCMLIINKVDRHKLMRPDCAKQLCEGIENEFLKRLLLSGNVIVVPRLRVGDSIDLLKDANVNIKKALQELTAYPMRHINMSVTFNSDTTEELFKIYKKVMAETIRRMRESVYAKDIPDVMASAKSFDQLLLKNVLVKMLHPLSSQHYDIARKNFDFPKEHDMIVQEIKLTRMQQERLSMEKAKLEQEKRVADAQKATEQARIKAEQAEIAQRNAQAKAQQLAMEVQQMRTQASLSEQEKMQLEKQAEEQRQYAIEAEKNKDALLRSYKSIEAQKQQAEANMQSMRESQARAERDASNAQRALERMRDQQDSSERQMRDLRNQISELRSSQNDEIQTLRSRVKDLEEKNSRLEREKDNLDTANDRLRERLQTVMYGGGIPMMLGGGGLVMGYP